MLASDDPDWSMKVMLFYTICLAAGSIALIVLSFIWFTGYSFEEG
jgi:hypothetical protein